MYRYPNPSDTRKRRHYIQALVAVVVILAIAFIGLFVAYIDSSKANNNTREMLVAKVQAESSNAQTRAYQLSQTGGSNVASLVAATRQHVYSLTVLNSVYTGIYGPGSMLVEDTLITQCIALLDECDTKQQAGLVLTETFANLRIAIDALYDYAEMLQS